MTTSVEIEQVLEELTLEEKAALLSLASAWESRPLEHLGIRPIWFADGPSGVRREIAPLASLPATCFPTQSSLGSTWDRDVVRRVGEALGREAAAQGVAVLLGPGLSMKRTPLNGRNFENFSEDPLLTGELAAAYVQGLQSRGVGASLKPFAANNQETWRWHVSAQVDERTFREIYGAATERVVRLAEPWTVMAAYNRLNGVFATQNRWLLTTVLREEYGYAGLVISDWCAIHDRMASLEAGTDLEADFHPGREIAEVVDAVRQGRLDEAVLDRSARRFLELLARTSASSASPPLSPQEVDDHHRLAREAAGKGVVLLRNTGLLPLRREGLHVAVIGRYAAEPHIQGGGSSLVNPIRVESVIDALDDRGTPYSYAEGFALDTDAADARLEQAAVAAASAADVAIVFLGQGDGPESEGWDRTTLDIPANQLAVLAAVVRTGKPVVAVLVGGSALRVEPWHETVGALVLGGLAGQAAGPALVDVLLGDVNPSGRLSESFPVRVQDSPSYVTFPGERGVVVYGEGVFIGYRWYDALELPVSYPFGHGLSYTSFRYDDLALDVHDAARAQVVVSLTLTNTGPRSGAEVVQLYVGDPESVVRRPVRELRGFERVTLEPGESRRVTFELGNRDFTWFDVWDRTWRREAGTFVVEAGASSRDIRLRGTLELPDDPSAPPLTSDDPGIRRALQDRRGPNPYAEDVPHLPE